MKRLVAQKEESASVPDCVATEPTCRRHSRRVQVAAQPCLEGLPDLTYLGLIAAGHELCRGGDRVYVHHGKGPGRGVHNHLLTQGRNLYRRAGAKRLGIAE